MDVDHVIHNPGPRNAAGLIDDSGSEPIAVTEVIFPCSTLVSFFPFSFVHIG